MRRAVAFLKNARKKVQKSGKIGIVFPLRKCEKISPKADLCRCFHKLSFALPWEILCILHNFELAF